MPRKYKYANLISYLEDQDTSTTEITLSFSQVEEIIGDELPPSAYTYQAWWSNDKTSHPWSREWLKIGWRSESVDFGNKRVTFVRQSD